MDFQFARNLSAISRALQATESALLQVGSCADCLNREAILPLSTSDEADQLLDDVRRDLLRLQTILLERQDEVEGRLRAAQVAYLLEPPVQGGSGSSSCPEDESPSSPPLPGASSCSTCKRNSNDGHSYAETALRGPVRGLHE